MIYDSLSDRPASFWVIFLTAMLDTPLVADAIHYNSEMVSICWKCSGTGFKPVKNSQLHLKRECTVCKGKASLVPYHKVKESRPYRPFKPKDWVIPGPLAAFDMFDERV
jgi:hypothetical protein